MNPPDEDADAIEAATKRYHAAAHAMQSGVATEISDPELQKSIDPKHLRVGINSAMSDNAALALLLIRKGFITNREYTEALADAMEREKRRYEVYLSEHLGMTIKLG